MIRVILAVAALASVVATTAQADVNISISGPGEVLLNQQNASGKWEVRLRPTAASSTVTFTITGTSNDPIEFIEVLYDITSQSTEARLVIRGEAPNPTQLPSVDRIEALIGGFNGRVTLEELRTSGDVGEITATTIRTADIGGDLNGPVDVAGYGGVFALSIEQMDVGGDILGDIYAGNTVGTIDVDGVIGSAGSPIDFDIGFAIRNLVADEIHATIGTDIDIHRLETRVGDLSGALQFVDFGSLSGATGTPGLFVAGDLAARVHIDDHLNTPIDIGGVIAAGKRIIVEESISNTITLASGGLIGNIVVRGDWKSAVTVGTTSLSPKPLYTQTGLGGGAVGEMPFSCHLQDCSPAYSAGGAMPVVTTTPSQIVLRHYGSVCWDDGNNNPPYVISHCSNSTECAPGENVVTADWQIALGSNERDAVLSLRPGKSLLADHHYHFDPITVSAQGKVLFTLCDGDPPSSNTPAREYMYTFSFEP